MPFLARWPGVDIGETRSLAAELAERARAMQDRLAAWRREVNAPMPMLHNLSAE